MVRIKERYLLVNILYPSDIGTKPALPDVVLLHQPTTDKLHYNALLRGVRDEASALFGDYGAGAVSNLQVKYLSPATSTFILRVSRAHYRLVWAALTAMSRVPVRDGKPCTFRVVHVSGTMRKVEEEAVRRSRDMMLALKDDAGAKDNAALARLLGDVQQQQQQRRRPTRAATTMTGASDVEDESGQDEEMEDVGGG